MWPLSGKEIYRAITHDENSVNVFDNCIILGVSSDSRKITPNNLFVAIQGEQYDGHAYLAECFEKGVQIALVHKDSEFIKKLSPENQKKCIQVENVIDKFRNFAKFMRSRFDFPVIAVAGSNGKTTTKEMIFSLLNSETEKVTKTEKSENGFLGMALTLCQEAHNISSPPHALILEIGIDEVGAMSQHVSLSTPHISLITALGPEHLERLIDWDTAASEELILFQNLNSKKIWQLSDQKLLTEFNHQIEKNSCNDKNAISTINDYIIIEKNNFEKIENKDKLLNFVKKIIIWELTQSSSFDNTVKFEILPKENHYKNCEFKILMPGIHNVTNFALAFSVAIMLNKSINYIQECWKNFTIPPMRSNIKKLKNGNILFDDTYNSSPMSLEAALHFFDNKDFYNKEKLIILGDMLELGTESKYWHEKIFYSLKNLQNSYLCLYGSGMYDCYKLLKNIEDELISLNNTKIYWLAKSEDPNKFLSEIKVNLLDFLILVKGSRGMKLDRIVKTIEKNF